jgi:hypothetical protein
MIWWGIGREVPMTEFEYRGQAVVAEHVTGSVSNPEDLDKKIAEAWAALIAKPTKKAEIAKALGVNEENLRPEDSPFHAATGQSGVVLTTILILLAKGFLGGVGAGAGKASFEYMQSLWKEVASPLEDPRTQTLGAPVIPQTIDTAEQATIPLPPKESSNPS